jgi:hypothetical protein
MRRVSLFAIAIVTLVCFGFGELARNSPALAQSNVPPGIPLVPSAIGPLSSGLPGAGPAPAVTTLAPLALPAAAPSTAAPGAPAALATTSALPVLNPAPVIVAGGPTPVPQSVFTCSCFGLGFGTRWVGRVQSTNFQNASNAAGAQCTAYAISSGTLSPYIPPPGAVSLGRNPYPNVNPNGAPGNVATGTSTVNGITSFRGTSVFTETSAATSGVPPRAAGCTRCACD